MANNTKEDADAKKKEEAQKRADEAKHVREAEEAAKKQAKRPDYEVEQGKSIACARGIVKEGEAITALDFVKSKKDEAEGQRRLDELVAKKYVRCNKPPKG